MLRDIALVQKREIGERSLKGFSLLTLHPSRLTPHPSRDRPPGGKARLYGSARCANAECPEPLEEDQRPCNGEAHHTGRYTTLCHFDPPSVIFDPPLSFRPQGEILVPSPSFLLRVNSGRDLKDSSSLSLLGMTQNGEIQSSHHYLLPLSGRNPFP